MNKVYNINSTINEKYLYKNIVRSSRDENCILDMNNFQFDFRNLNLEKKASLNKRVFIYFKPQKTDLKFIFLKKPNKSKQSKLNIVLRNIKQSKTKCLITKHIRSGFRTISHKYKGFIQKRDLPTITRKFKIQLLSKFQTLPNSVYLTNLHKARTFLFHKIVFTRDNEEYTNFRLLTKKAYNKKRRKKTIKLKLQNKITLRLFKNLKINRKHEKKSSTKKGIKKSYKQKNFKNKNYNKYPKKRISIN